MGPSVYPASLLDVALKLIGRRETLLAAKLTNISLIVEVVHYVLVILRVLVVLGHSTVFCELRATAGHVLS
jgi:hypothetical protein